MIIIDYGSGNLRSVVNIFEMAVGMRYVNCNVFVMNKPDNISNNNKIIILGVGNYFDCLNNYQVFQI